MSQRILVLWWSQSGQVKRMVDALTGPLVDAGHDVRFVEIAPAVDYPFPWSVPKFFGLFPETVLARPIELAPVEIPEGDWDLIVAAGQIWFLSPSQVWTALLAGPHARVFAGRRVLTLIGCRNMWINGWRRMVRRIQAAGGTVTDRVVVTHGGNVFASYFTTLLWMLTGKRDAIKALPKAQVEEMKFARLAEWGALVAQRLGTEQPGTERLGRDGSLLADQTTASVSHMHALGEQLMARVFPVIAAIAAAVTRPGSFLRGVFAYWQLCFTLSSVFGLLIPCAITRALLRRWVDPWLDSLAELPVD